MIGLLGMVATAAAAPALTHELGVGLGVGYQGGDTVVAGGLGGDVRYRLGVGDHLVVHTSVGPRLYLAPALEIDVGAGWSIPLRPRWSFTLGAEAAVMAGGVVRRITREDIDPLSGAPVAIRAFVNPIEYRAERFTVRALGLSGGVGVDAPDKTVAIGVRLFEVGVGL